MIQFRAQDLPPAPNRAGIVPQPPAPKPLGTVPQAPSHQAPTSQAPTHQAYASQASPPNKRKHDVGWKRILLIVFLIPVVLLGLFLLLGLVLVALGSGGFDDATQAVEGAEIVDEYIGTNGGTTWTVVLDDENPTDTELASIANALISLPTVEPLLDEGLDILLFDDGGRTLRDITETTQELDRVGPEGDIDRILELAQDFPTDWVADHSLGSIDAGINSDGVASYTFCAKPFGDVPGCTPAERTQLKPQQ